MIDDALREELSALLDGALPEERAKELRLRIEKDAELRREYRELEHTMLLVRGLPRAGAPAELRSRLRGSLGEARARGKVFRLAALAVAAALLLAAALALSLRDGKPRHYDAKADRPEAPVDKDDRAEGFLRDDQAKLLGRSAPGARDRLAREQDEALEAAAPDAPGAEVAVAEKREESERAKDQADLLALVAQGHEPRHDERKAYLRQLAALEPEKAQEHLRAAVPEESPGAEREPAPGRRGPPVLATILLEDREEADLVQRILGTAPPAATAGATASAFVEEEEKDQLSTEVEGTPEELRRLGRWLALLDLSVKNATGPRATISGVAKEAKAEKARKAVVRLRFAKPPEPKPESPASPDK